MRAAVSVGGADRGGNVAAVELGPRLGDRPWREAVGALQPFIAHAGAAAAAGDRVQRLGPAL